MTVPFYSYAASPEPDKSKASEDSFWNTRFETVTLESQDTTGFFSKRPVVIKGFLLKATTTGPAPGAVLAPACNGFLLKDGSVKPYYQKMAKFLNDLGMTVLLVDGFSPRGFEEICTQPVKTRTVDTDVRLKDIQGGLLYLRGRNDVAADKIILVTWGAAGSFQAMNKGSSYYEKIGPAFAGAVMFYPQCDQMDSRFAPYAPIQMFVGEDDKWNPAAPCRSLAERKEPGSAAFDIKVYPGTYHAFDQFIPPRLYTGGPAGPVMVGANPQSAADAYKTTEAFLSRTIGVSTPK